MKQLNPNSGDEKFEQLWAIKPHTRDTLVNQQRHKVLA